MASMVKVVVHVPLHLSKNDRDHVRDDGFGGRSYVLQLENRQYARGQEPSILLEQLVVPSAKGYYSLYTPKSAL